MDILRAHRDHHRRDHRDHRTVVLVTAETEWNTKAIRAELLAATNKVALAAQRTGRQRKALDGTVQNQAIATALDHIEYIHGSDREDELLEISQMIQAEAKRLWPDPHVYPSKRIMHIVEGLDIANSIVMAQPRPSKRIPAELLVPQWWVRFAFIGAIAFAAGTVVFNVLQ